MSISQVWSFLLTEKSARLETAIFLIVNEFHRQCTEIIIHSIQINFSCTIPAVDQEKFSIVHMNSSGSCFELLKDTQLPNCQEISFPCVVVVSIG